MRTSYHERKGCMSQESNFSYTLKTPRAGNLFTVRGDTADEAKANLDAAVSSGLLTTISQIEASLSGQPAPAAAPQAPPAASQPAQELPAGFGVKCGTCGGATRFEQEGISRKSGAPYKRYSCTVSALHPSTFTS
jgi:uncharacterized protein YggE